MSKPANETSILVTHNIFRNNKILDNIFKVQVSSTFKKASIRSNNKNFILGKSGNNEKMEVIPFT